MNPPKLEHYVNDASKVLSESVRHEVNERLKNHDTQTTVQAVVYQEGIWLTECIASFSHDLDTWMTRHYSELVQLQGSVDAQVRTTDIAEGKAALGLTEERISRLSEEIPIRVK